MHYLKNKQEKKNKVVALMGGSFSGIYSNIQGKKQSFITPQSKIQLKKSMKES